MIGLAIFFYAIGGFLVYRGVLSLSGKKLSQRITGGIWMGIGIFVIITVTLKISGII